MKAKTYITTFAGFLGAASASHAHQGHHEAHEALLERALATESASVANATLDAAACGCTTSIMTYFGEAMLVPDEATTTTIQSTQYTTVTIPASSAAAVEASSVPAAAVPTSSSSEAAVAYSYTSAPAYVPSSPLSSEAAPAYSAPAETSSAVVVVVPSSSAVASAPVASSSSTVSSTGFTTNGNKWAMTYSPYTDASACKDSTTMAADIAQIKAMGFAGIRIYSTDCDGLSVIGDAARANGLKLILGVYISESGTADAQEQVDDIVSWAQWDLVELISVGNEAIFNGWVSAAALATFIGSAKSSFQSAGYSGKITTTETVGTWQSDGAALCDVVDVLGANIHPFFAAIEPSESATFIAEQITMVEAVCSGKPAVNLEVGWPTAGECNGPACPGYSEQSTALAATLDGVGAQSVFFSYQNELWKSPGEFDVEQAWGCGQWFL